MESGEAEPPPVEQIVRDGDGDARTMTRQRRIGHHVRLERLDEAYAGIFAAPACLREFVVGLGRQRHAEPLDARRIAPVIEENPGQANARVVATPDQAREKIEAAVLGTDDCRIEHALDLIRISRLRLHQHPETGELERGHATFSPSRQAMTVSMTRLVSSGSRTLIDATPTCFAG